MKFADTHLGALVGEQPPRLCFNFRGTGESIGSSLFEKFIVGHASPEKVGQTGSELVGAESDDFRRRFFTWCFNSIKKLRRLQHRLEDRSEGGVMTKCWG